MSTQLQRNLTALAGILGTVALVAYYAAPFTFMPLPPANAPAAQVIAFGTAYQNVILFDAWLQAIGALLSVVFVLALVQMAGTASRLAGRLTLLAGGVVLALALAEGTFEIGAVMAAANGHIQTSLVCFDLTYTFIHVFVIAPSLFLMLGLALRGTHLLPAAFSTVALVLGGAFETLGLVSLFSTAALLLVIVVLMAQNVWSIAAALVLALRPAKPTVA